MCQWLDTRPMEPNSQARNSTFSNGNDSRTEIANHSGVCLCFRDHEIPEIESRSKLGDIHVPDITRDVFQSRRWSIYMGITVDVEHLEVNFHSSAQIRTEIGVHVLESYTFSSPLILTACQFSRWRFVEVRSKLR